MRLHQLDGLRGIFAMMIVLHHFEVPPYYSSEYFLIKQSAIFTDFFFVLSGFVISYTYFDRIERRTFISRFCEKALRETLPAAGFYCLHISVFQDRD